MLSSVSGVSFKGDVAPNQNVQDLLSSPGKFSAPIADNPPDSFAKEGAEKKKKSKAPAIIGTLVALAAATYIGLGVAVSKSKLNKVVAQEGKELKFTEKVQNFFHSIGENAESMWNKIRGKKSEGGDTKPEAKPKDDVPKPSANEDTKTEA